MGQKEKKVALVIGNATYENASKLANPCNDANAIGRALMRLGFSNAAPQLNLDYNSLRRAIQKFSSEVEAAEMVAIYFAGHGIEVDGRNFLIPVDAKLERAGDVTFEAIALDQLLAMLDGPRKLSLVILDACRTNPFRTRLKGLTTRSLGEGLRAIEPTGNLLVAYAAKHGTYALDEGIGRNSPYAESLLAHIETPDLEVGQLFREIRDDVLTRTRGRQEPHIYGSLGAKGIYLRPPSFAGAPPQRPVTGHVSSSLSEPGERRIRGLQSWVFNWPVRVAAVSLTALAATQTSPGSERVPAPTPPISPEFATATITPMPQLKPSSSLGKGEPFQDFSEAPKMVVVPAGSFLMGSPESETGRFSDEGPQHRVTITKPFAVGQFEVTFDEWDACVRDGNRSAKGRLADKLGCTRMPPDRGWGRGNLPVINVTRKEIVEEFLPWISKKSGHQYRLLTEAEWEYAARAGSESAYSWGENAGVGKANCGQCGSKWDNQQTAPVNSFTANAWGLYNMSGNVFELVQDCYADSYSGAPVDGTAVMPRSSSSCSLLVARGGAWGDILTDIRAAKRWEGRSGGSSADNDGFRLPADNVGFRIARNLTP